MTPKQIHIGIEQGLQVLGSYIYSDFKPKEIDLQFNTTCDKMIDSIFKNTFVNNEEKKIFDEYQFVLDDLRLLKVVDSVLPSSNRVFDLPANYRNLISDESLVKRACFTYVKSGEIKPDIYYLVERDSGILSYNNENISSGEYFLGIEEITTFTVIDNVPKVIGLIEKPNRLVEAEFKGKLRVNPFTKTRWESPISELYGNSLKVTTNDTFTVPYILIEYIRKLVPLNSDTFNVDWNTEFPDYVIRTLIDLTVKRMLFLVESNRYSVANNELVK